MIPCAYIDNYFCIVIRFINSKHIGIIVNVQHYKSNYFEFVAFFKLDKAYLDALHVLGSLSIEHRPITISFDIGKG